MQKNKNLIFLFEYIDRNRLIILNINILNKKNYLKKYFFIII